MWPKQENLSFSVSEQDKMCWDCPSTVILHFSALSHRIDSFLTSTPSSYKNTFLPSGSLFWGLTYLSVTGAEKSKRKTQQISWTTNLTKWIIQLPFYGRIKSNKQSNFDIFSLLCPVSLFRWLCLRLLWLPWVCDIDLPPVLENPKQSCRKDKSGHSTL